jgi:alpha-galactosidase
MPQSPSPGLSLIACANEAKSVFALALDFMNVLKVVCVLLLAVPFSSQALTNNLALTPPMGWNSWNHFACNVSDSMLRGIADALATNGMKAAGYQFINIDDCWQVARDTNGVIVADPTRFPNGIKALADYVHAKGLKLGVYSDHGPTTCAGRPGGYAYEYLDANTYAAWGVDYLKYDNCNLPPGDVPQTDYARMADALMKSGRPITFSLCYWSFASWEPVTGKLWRTTGDINDSFGSMMSNLSGNSPPAFFAGPGRWNDPDMLEVGNGGMTTTEDQAHFSLWCLVSAPLIAGNDLTAMSAQTLSILTNAELIAVDQDPAGEQGVPLPNAGTNQIWVKPLGSDFTTKAVGLFNPNTNAATITVNWTNIGLLGGSATVRDLWAGANLGTFNDSFTTNVPAHGVVALKVVGAAPLLPGLGTNYLTTLQPVYTYVGWGSLTSNKSIGGNPIKLNGKTYSRLGGACLFGCRISSGRHGFPIPV